MKQREAALPPNAQARIGKQIMLPWSKAIEIAFKSIRVRFWRSMITMSSIILAIAFLMSIWTSTAITAGLDLGPQRELESLKQRLAVVRRAMRGGAGAPSKAQVEQQYARDLAAARARKERAIYAKQQAIKTATSDEAKRLTAEVEALKADLEAAKSLALLESYLLDRRRETEAVKGRLDTILQQERVKGDAAAATGEAPQAQPEAAPAAKAQAGSGGIGTFLSYMTPTDKWLAVLALLVCFVGIVNAMFMTVQERFREIGTMKCLGALDAFIVKIFLVESTALGFIGTLAGILIGVVLSTLRQWLVYGSPTFSYLPLGSLGFAALMAAIVGLVLSAGAAILPARSAARMEPVEAMRIEE